MREEHNRVWRNHAGNVSSTPSRTVWPETVEDVRDIVRRAESAGSTVRALGSSHSWSDVAVTEGHLVVMEQLNRPLDIGNYGLRDLPEERRDRLVWVEGGMTIRALNAWLDSRGLALMNLGGYDGQTITGVTSTSTHGSGITFGPLCDAIASLEIVGGGGIVYRIEPSPDSGAALTDPTKFASVFPDSTTHRLVQDDTWFNAAIVGMGCLGVITSVVLRVRDAFRLKETRTATTWESIRETLRGGGVYHTPEHWELLFNPYSVKGRHSCLITQRIPTTEQNGDGHRPLYSEFKAVLEISTLWARFVHWIKPSGIRDTLDLAIKGLQDNEYIAKSYEVFHIGEANEIKVVSAEFAVPVENDAYIEAIERLMATAEEVGRKERVYLTVPVAARFVKGSSALLSPMHNRDTCMLEVISLTRIAKSDVLMRRIEEALAPLRLRPHWGQINNLNSASLAAMYGPSLATWKTVRAALDPRHTFANTFSRRVGLDS